MKKLLILPFLLLISGHSFAGEGQAEEDINKYEYAQFHLGGLSLGFNFSNYDLDYINNQINNRNEKGTMIDPINNGIGYSIGLRFPLWISKESCYTSGFMGGYEFTRLYAGSTSTFPDDSINYYLPLNVHDLNFLYYRMVVPDFVVYLGVGIGYYSCKGEITAEANADNPYKRSTLKGNTIGIKPFIELQYFLSTEASIQAQIGYRLAKMNDLEEKVGATDASLNWSGISFRIGLVLYLVGA